MTPIPVRPMGMLIDLTRCRGCGHCVAACNRIHGFPKGPAAAAEMSARSLTVVWKGEESWVRNLCRHCVSPACASACIVGALRKTPLGPVAYDADKCIGCRYCLLACPFNVPRYEWESANPKVQKCDLCSDRVEKGESPACVQACPFEATVFGPREDLVRQAHERIAAKPAEYFDHVYGEREVGGTSVLFIGPAPLDVLGFKPVLGERPLPELTAEALGRVPAIVLCGGVALTGLWWIIKRRDEVALAKAAAGRAAHERMRHSGDAPPPEVRHDR